MHTVWLNMMDFAWMAVYLQEKSKLHKKNIVLYFLLTNNLYGHDIINLNMFYSPSAAGVSMTRLNVM